MIPATPSRTAYRVALGRAAHQLLDRPPVLDDPLALPILRPEDADLLRADPGHFERSPVAPFLRAFLAVRARFAEDQLLHASAQGVRQYVILGAGLDTFPYRDPARASNLRIWEVDHPATQSWKRRRLAEAGLPIPTHVTFVPVDFEREDPGRALDRAGFDADAGALFGWLGVTPYLTAGAIRSTLEFIAAATRSGGGVVFDYALDPVGLPPLRRRAYDLLADRVRAGGEPFRSAFQPAALEADLRGPGFRVVEDVGPEALNARYFARRTDGLRVGGLAHLMYAGAVPLAA